MKYPMIPCASLLIGVVQNKNDEIKEIPEYNSKLFNTILFHV
jgi:hypothetical protein